MATEYAILDDTGIERFDSQVGVFFGLLARGQSPVEALLLIGQHVQVDLSAQAGGPDAQ